MIDTVISAVISLANSPQALLALVVLFIVYTLGKVDIERTRRDKNRKRRKGRK